VSPRVRPAALAAPPRDGLANPAAHGFHFPDARPLTPHGHEVPPCIALVTATAAAASYALAARRSFASGAAAIAALTWVLRGCFIPRMDMLGTQIHANNVVALPAFRKIHKSAILLNLVQLLVIVGSLGTF